MSADDRRFLSVFLPNRLADLVSAHENPCFVYHTLFDYAWDLSIMSRASNNINMRQLPCPVQYNGGWGSELRTYNSRDECSRAFDEVFHRKRWSTRVAIIIMEVIHPMRTTLYPTWERAPTFTEIDFAREILDNYYALHEDIRALRPRLVITYTQVREAIDAHDIIIRSRPQEWRAEAWMTRLIDLTGDGEVATELECPICYENIKQDGEHCHVKMPCGHDLCGTCTNGIMEHERKTKIKCPMCRAVGLPQKQ